MTLNVNIPFIGTISIPIGGSKIVGDGHSQPSSPGPHVRSSMDIGSQRKPPSSGMSPHRASIGDRSANNVESATEVTPAELKASPTTLARVTDAKTGSSKLMGRPGSSPSTPTPLSAAHQAAAALAAAHELGTVSDSSEGRPVTAQKLGVDALPSHQLEPGPVVDLEEACDLLDDVKSETSQMLRYRLKIDPAEIADAHASAQTFVSSLHGELDNDLDLIEELKDLDGGVSDWKHFAGALVKAAESEHSPSTDVIATASKIFSLATEAEAKLSDMLAEHRSRKKARHGNGQAATRSAIGAHHFATTNCLAV